jgi:uncharacterized protein YycO
MEPVMQLKLMAAARDDPDDVNMSGEFDKILKTSYSNVVQQMKIKYYVIKATVQNDYTQNTKF